MIIKEQELVIKKQNEDEFLEELSRLVAQYGPLVPTGSMVGLLEVVQFRLLMIASNSFDKAQN